MSDIYDLHKAAFKNVAAYVIARNGDRVATIAFKYPRDGAGRLYAYVHWIGLPMVRGFASGYGYDKHSAAVSAAVAKMARHDAAEESSAARKAGKQLAAQAAEMSAIAKNEMLSQFLAATSRDDGAYWHDRLRKAGFDVWSAV